MFGCIYVQGDRRMDDRLSRVRLRLVNRVRHCQRVGAAACQVRRWRRWGRRQEAASLQGRPCHAVYRRPSPVRSDAPGLPPSSSSRPHNEMKRKQNSFSKLFRNSFWSCFRILFQPKRNAPAVKRSSCFSQSLSVSAVIWAPKPEAGAGWLRMRDVVVVCAGK